MAGQGTIAPRDLRRRCPTIDTLIVAIGGGGLIAGVGDRGQGAAARHAHHRRRAGRRADAACQPCRRPRRRAARDHDDRADDGARARPTRSIFDIIRRHRRRHRAGERRGDARGGAIFVVRERPRRSICRAPPRSPRCSPAACAPKPENAPARWSAAPARMGLFKPRGILRPSFRPSSRTSGMRPHPDLSRGEGMIREAHHDERISRESGRRRRRAASVATPRRWRSWGRRRAAASGGWRSTPTTTRRGASSSTGRADLGFAVSLDPVGNLFIRRDGSARDAEPVMSGSHMDSQPTGGRFDGIYGVLAAFEALEALEDAGVKTSRPVMAVAWTNEEGGARFQPGAMGSGGFAGLKPLDEMLRPRKMPGRPSARAEGDALAETLKDGAGAARSGLPGRLLSRGAYRAGPAAGERAEDDRRRHRDPGQPALHRRRSRARRRMPARRRAPPARTPMPRRPGRRRDVRGDHDEGDTLRFTIGRVEVRPARPTPCRARSSSPSTCAIRATRCWRRTRPSSQAIVAAKAGALPGAGIERVTNVAPTDFDPKVIGLVRARRASARPLQHGHALGRRARRHAHRPALPGRHDLRALRARHQPQRDRERDARGPRRRRARPRGSDGRAGRLGAIDDVAQFPTGGEAIEIVRHHAASGGRAACRSSPRRAAS